MKQLGAAFIVVVVAVAACGGKKSKPPADAGAAAVAVAPDAAPDAPPAPEEDDVDGKPVARKPTAEEVNRCARLLVITSKCGVSDDYEFGWIKSDVKPRNTTEATKACDVPSVVDEDGMSAMPVTVLEPDQLAKVETASKRNCQAVFAALDEVDERIGPAGHDPSE